MPEVGVADRPQQGYGVEGDPRDIIELNHDIYKPSVRYTQMCDAIQKDMVLANLTKQDIGYIKGVFSLNETLITLYRRNPVRYSALNDAVNDLVTEIANIITLSRGEDGFTAKLMRKTIYEQKSTMGHELGYEKRREGAIDKGKRRLGLV